jgi:LysM repeat protein
MLKYSLNIIAILMILMMFSNEIVSQSDSTLLKTSNLSLQTLTVEKDSIQAIRQSLIDSIINYGKTYVNANYRYGGITPDGFDCSGFMFHIHRHFNLPLPRVPSITCLMGERIELDSLLPGDFVYFKNRTSNNNSIGHVAMVVEKLLDDFVMIHSASHAGVIIENYADKPYYVSTYLFANRLPDEFYLRQWNDSLEKIYKYKNADIFNEHVCSTIPVSQPEGTTLLNYTVRSGDMLGLIASYYNVSVNELLAWNGLSSTRLSIGQNIKLYIKNELVSHYEDVNNMSYEELEVFAKSNSSAARFQENTDSALDENYEYYTVQAGDNPYSISKKIPGTTPESIVSLNGINPMNLQIGQKLKIRKK